MKTLNMHPSIQNLEGGGVVKAILSLDNGAAYAPQVQKYFQGLEDPRKFKKVALVGQGTAGSLVLPVLEMMAGLPTIICYGMGKDARPLGELDLSEYRHNVVRPRRAELPHGEAFVGFTVIDGTGRGLTPVQKTELAAQLGVEESMIRVLSADMGQVDFATPQTGMVEKLISFGLTFQDWTSGRILHLPAGSGVVAAVMATTIYGIGETWPRAIRLNKADDGQFHVAELADCHGQRQFGVQLAAELERAGAPIAVPRKLFEEVVVLLEQFLSEGQVGDAAVLQELKKLRG